MYESWKCTDEQRNFVGCTYEFKVIKTIEIENIKNLN